MIAARPVAGLSTTMLIRVLNAAGLAMALPARPRERAGDGPGSDAQLRRKIEQIKDELRRRAMDGAWCAAVGCVEEADASGLCDVHRRRWLAGRRVELGGPLPAGSELERNPPPPEPPRRPGWAWRGRRSAAGPGAAPRPAPPPAAKRPAGPDAETPRRRKGRRRQETRDAETTDMMHKCTDCDRTFAKAHGLEIHRRRVHGPRAIGGRRPAAARTAAGGPPAAAPAQTAPAEMMPAKAADGPPAGEAGDLLRKIEQAVLFTLAVFDVTVASWSMHAGLVIVRTENGRAVRIGHDGTVGAGTVTIDPA